MKIKSLIICLIFYKSVLTQDKSFLKINKSLPLDMQQVREILDSGIDQPVNSRGWTLLHLAAYFRSSNFISELLKKGASKDVRTKNGSTALAFASAIGDLTSVETLVQHGANVNIANHSENTPLFMASAAGRLGIVKLLLSVGAKLEAESIYPSERKHTHESVGCYFATPLEAAVQAGHCEVALELIKHGANVFRSANFVGSLLHIAAKYNYLDLAKALISKGLNVDVVGSFYYSFNHTPLFCALEQEHYDMAKYLIASGANINKCFNHDNFLLVAIKQGNLRVVRTLLKFGADPNLVCVGYSCIRRPLTEAVYYKNKDIVEALINSGADLNKYDVVSAVVKTGNYEIFKILKERIPKDSTEVYKNTLLHEAVETSNNLDILNELIELGLNVNALNDRKEAPLHCVGENTDYIETLVKNGADLELVNGLGRTPLLEAAFRLDVNSVKKFISLGANYRAIDSDGNTILHWASKYYEFLEKLLGLQGLDFNAKNNRGETPLDFLLIISTCYWRIGRENLLPTIKLLLKNGAQVSRSSIENSLGACVSEASKLLIQNFESFQINERDEDGNNYLQSFLIKVRKKAFCPSSSGLDESHYKHFWDKKDLKRLNNQLKLLLNLGADVNSENDKKDTAIQIISSFRNKLGMFLISLVMYFEDFEKEIKKLDDIRVLKEVENLNNIKERLEEFKKVSVMEVPLSKKISFVQDDFIVSTRREPSDIKRWVDFDDTETPFVIKILLESINSLEVDTQEHYKFLSLLIFMAQKIANNILDDYKTKTFEFSSGKIQLPKELAIRIILQHYLPKSLWKYLDFKIKVGCGDFISFNNLVAQELAKKIDSLKSN